MGEDGAGSGPGAWKGAVAGAGTMVVLGMELDVTEGKFIAVRKEGCARVLILIPGRG